MVTRRSFWEIFRFTLRQSEMRRAHPAPIKSRALNRPSADKLSLCHHCHRSRRFHSVPLHHVKVVGNSGTCSQMRDSFHAYTGRDVVLKHVATYSITIFGFQVLCFQLRVVSKSLVNLLIRFWVHNLEHSIRSRVPSEISKLGLHQVFRRLLVV